LSWLCPTTGYYKLKVIPYTGDAGAYVFNYKYVVLPTPTNMHLAKSGSNVLLTWTPVSGATLYKVYHSNSPTTGFTQLVTTSVASVLISPATVRKFYYVIATN
jgi:hypothetical protein